MPFAKRPSSDSPSLDSEPHRSMAPPHLEESGGIIQRLKDDFGDYTDPLSYDWSWREPETD